MIIKKIGIDKIGFFRNLIATFTGTTTTTTTEPPPSPPTTTTTTTLPPAS